MSATDSVVSEIQSSVDAARQAFDKMEAAAGDLRSAIEQQDTKSLPLARESFAQAAREVTSLVELAIRHVGNG